MKRTSRGLRAGVLGALVPFALSGKAESLLRLQNDSEVKSSINSEKKLVKAGETLVLTGREVLTIEARGRVPMVIVPMETAHGTLVDVTQPEVDQWPSEQIQATLDRSLSKILDRVLKVQDLLLQKKSDEAFREVDQLKAEFPGVTYLDFLRASALLLKGNREEAVASLKRALAAHPDNVRGQELLKALGGSGP